ncbi:MAG TPA: 16S rRNA methyltransferase [Rhodobacteraceae bacterium]|jgi:16S rRNA (cytosine967-C5)-methyltransferase|nr:methyltransferase domain-containing protein [Rhodobacter sp.]HBN32552.1 16S rRNA methyltransferase [Paracoccaceae bacterium]
MSTAGIGARLAAAQMLHAVLFEKLLMSEAMVGKGNPLDRLAPQDRARAQSLANGVLRHLAALDAVLDQFLEKSPPLKVRNALRLATFEMLAEDIAPHAAVNAAVEIVRGSPKTTHMAGLTNAVARRVAAEGAAIWAQQGPQKLPNWLATPISKNYGAAVVGAIEAAHQVGAAIDLTLKHPEQATDWAARLGATVLPTGSLRLKGRPQVTALEGFDRGDWWVQDAAAAMPARLFGDVKSLNALDLCAAPGGKTMQLAAGGAKVTALDISADRLGRVNENLTRVKLNARVIAADVLQFETDQRYDAILLDAPCSATGTIRRHPDLPFAKDGVDLSGLFELQAAMLDKALQLLKPGGRLVYCTCSLLPREGETQIAQALGRHDGLKVLDIDPVALGGDAVWSVAGGGLRLRPDYWPDLGGMDGFYMVCLQSPS